MAFTNPGISAMTAYCKGVNDAFEGLHKSLMELTPEEMDKINIGPAELTPEQVAQANADLAKLSPGQIAEINGEPEVLTPEQVAQANENLAKLSPEQVAATEIRSSEKLERHDVSSRDVVFSLETAPNSQGKWNRILLKKQPDKKGTFRLSVFEMRAEDGRAKHVEILTVDVKKQYFGIVSTSDTQSRVCKGKVVTKILQGKQKKEANLVTSLHDRISGVLLQNEVVYLYRNMSALQKALDCFSEKIGKVPVKLPSDAKLFPQPKRPIGGR